MVPPLPLPASNISSDGANFLLEEVCFCFFALTSLLAARTLARTSKPSFTGASAVNTGMQTRRSYVMGLLAANLVRCLSISLEFAVQTDAPMPFLNRLDREQLQWMRDLIAFLPGFVFISAFSVVVLFWARLHYTTMIVPLQLMDYLFVCINIVCYLLVAAIAVCTFLLKAYSHLETYMISIIGFLNVVVAISFFYYGLMVVSELAEISRKKLPGRRLTSAVMALSVACPIAFLVRGVCYLAWGFSAGHPSQFADLAICLASEWFPSVVALTILNRLQPCGRKSLEDPLDDSTDSEAPLLRDDSPTVPASPAGAPGFTWKQLYPQPTNA